MFSTAHFKEFKLDKDTEVVNRDLIPVLRSLSTLSDQKQAKTKEYTIDVYKN